MFPNKILQKVSKAEILQNAILLFYEYCPLCLHFLYQRFRQLIKFFFQGIHCVRNSLLRISLKMLYVSMKFVICLVTQEHTKVNVSQ